VPASSAGDFSLPQEDVQVFEVTEANSTAPIAHFFLDAYSRPGEKRGGAWMSDIVGRTELAALVPAGAGCRLPAAHLVCNSAPPVRSSQSNDACTVQL